MGYYFLALEAFLLIHFGCRKVSTGILPEEDDLKPLPRISRILEGCITIAGGIYIFFKTYSVYSEAILAPAAMYILVFPAAIIVGIFSSRGEPRPARTFWEGKGALVLFLLVLLPCLVICLHKE